LQLAVAVLVGGARPLQVSPHRPPDRSADCPLTGPVSGPVRRAIERLRGGAAHPAREEVLELASLAAALQAA
jgi:hypothetical protein